MGRFLLSVTMNLLVPGTGLMALGRIALGLAVAIWFGLSAEILLCRLLLVPATLPAWLGWTAAGLAAGAWIVGQWLLVARIRLLRDPNLPRELQALRALAEEAMNTGDFKAAHSALRVALSVDDSDLKSRLLWARLLTQASSRSKARRAWRALAHLDKDREYEPEIQVALQRLHST